MPLGINLQLLMMVNAVEAKDINEEAQIHAKLDGKKVAISEATLKRDLKFEDAEGIDCFSNKVIFEQLPLMGYQNLSQKLTFYKAYFSPQWKNMVIDLETSKITQAMEIDSLKRRVKKLEKKKKSRTHGLKRLYKVGLSVRIESSTKKCLEDQRSLNDQDEIMFDDYKDLQALKTSKLKIGGIVVRDHKEPSESTTTPTSVADSTRPKAKAIRLQAEIDEEERLAGERARLARMKAQQEKEANITLIEKWHDVQAKIKADYELAQRLQAEEQEQMSDAEKARLFMEFLEKRKKFLAAKKV
uniref:Uncharacterized protein n=1 Tax=Tanacetum cinerariifolium TaxID=118510 RepID=A0A6L2LIL5_TANCI|nr:hypothetical protein [Tanacetum cinerariifolium]